MNDNKESELYSRIKSFQYAFEGWRFVLRTQHNAWIHAVISLAVFATAFWLDLAATDWAILILAIMIVWVTEFVNTAVETVVDLAQSEINPLAKIAKDVAAAAVLLGAAGAVLVGILIMGPPLWKRFF